MRKYAFHFGKFDRMAPEFSWIFEPTEPPQDPVCVIGGCEPSCPAWPDCGHRAANRPARARALQGQHPARGLLTGRRGFRGLSTGRELPQVIRLGFAISIGPLTLWVGTPRPCLRIGRRRAIRKTTPPPVNPSATRKHKSSLARSTSPPSSVSSPLQARARADALAALIALGFKKRQAQAQTS